MSLLNFSDEKTAFEEKLNAIKNITNEKEIVEKVINDLNQITDINSISIEQGNGKEIEIQFDLSLRDKFSKMLLDHFAEKKVTLLDKAKKLMK
jgi:hypothetical protein